MKIDGASSPAHPRVWLGILGVGIALSTPVVQVLLIPWLESTFSFPVDRLVSLGVFWIALILVLSIAHFAEGYPLAAFGFQRNQKTLRARLLEWIGAVLAAVVTAGVIITFFQFCSWAINQSATSRLECDADFARMGYDSGLDYRFIY